MLKSYFKIAFRNLHRRKAYALINVLGLALGIACFLRHARLGFDKEQVVVLPADGVGPNYEALQRAFLQHPDVRQVAAVSSRPGISKGMDFVYEAEGLPDEAERRMFVQAVDYAFFDMLDLSTVAGRIFSEEFSTDLGTARRRAEPPYTPIYEDRSFVLNRSAAARLGWKPEEAVGKRMRFYISENGLLYQDLRGTVVGVIEDYHTASLHEPIEPTVFTPVALPDEQGRSYMMSTILVKTTPGDVEQTLGRLEAAWQSVVPDQPFEATFLDEEIDALYRVEIRLGKVIGAFSVLAVFIACLGLFGLAAFTAEQRTKEIGIRKVLGASMTDIVALLSRDFLLLVGIAAVIAAPIAYFGMRRWLEAFAYRIEIHPGVFLAAGLAALLIAFVTVSYQAIKAAVADPVDSLRYE